MAELKRSVIRERVVAGLEYARQPDPVDLSGDPKQSFAGTRPLTFARRDTHCAKLCVGWARPWAACVGPAGERTRPCKAAKNIHTVFGHGFRNFHEPALTGQVLPERAGVQP
jgi:hypothetical protein